MQAKEYPLSFKQAVAHFFTVVTDATFEQLERFTVAHQQLIVGKSQEELWRPKKRRSALRQTLESLRLDAPDGENILRLEHFPAAPPLIQPHTKTAPLLVARCQPNQKETPWQPELIDSAARLVANEWRRHYLWHLRGNRVELFCNQRSLAPRMADGGTNGFRSITLSLHHTEIYLWLLTAHRAHLHRVIATYRLYLNCALYELAPGDSRRIWIPSVSLDDLMKDAPSDLAPEICKQVLIETQGLDNPATLEFWCLGMRSLEDLHSSRETTS